MVDVLRRVAAGFVVSASVAVLPLAQQLSTAVGLSANTTALIMGGTFHSLMGPKDKPDFVKTFLANAVDGHLDPAFGVVSGPVTNAVAVFTPEDFFPIGPLTLDKSIAVGLANLNKCLAGAADCVYNADPAVNPGTAAPQAGDQMEIFGYSQSAMIASLAKRELIAQYQPGDPTTPFMLVANPMRPNGGVIMRLSGWSTIPILGISFPGASPTDSAVLDGGGYAFPTVDVVPQYDGIGGDFPLRPLNLIATLNSLLGYALLHGTADDLPLDQAVFQGRVGDTSYYLIEADLVPLLQPLRLFLPEAILQAIDAPLRVIIEDAYNRNIGPGVPTRASWWPVNDLFGMAVKLLASIPVAIDNLVEGLGLPRILGTQKPGAFGIGGPDVAPPLGGGMAETRSAAGESESSAVPEASVAAGAGDAGVDAAGGTEPEGTSPPQDDVEGPGEAPEPDATQLDTTDPVESLPPESEPSPAPESGSESGPESGTESATDPGAGAPAAPKPAKERAANDAAEAA